MSEQTDNLPELTKPPELTREDVLKDLAQLFERSDMVVCQIAGRRAAIGPDLVKLIVEALRKP